MVAFGGGWAPPPLHSLSPTHCVLLFLARRILVAFGGGWAYFFWLPAQYDSKQQVPAWLQDVGNFKVRGYLWVGMRLRWLEMYKWIVGWYLSKQQVPLQ